MPNRIHILDSHTGGEPTRLVMDGGPDLGTGPIQERLNLLKYRHDDFRRRVINEPRGNDVLVGALLLVLIVELLNSAIEASVDRISLEHHLLIKRAKDMGSAAVLLALLNVVLVWALLLLN